MLVGTNKAGEINWNSEMIGAVYYVTEIKVPFSNATLSADNVPWCLLTSQIQMHLSLLTRA